MNFKLRNSDVDIFGTFFGILVKQMTAHSRIVAQRLWSLNFTEIFSKSNHDSPGVETHRKTILFELKSWCIVVLYLLSRCGNPHILLQSIGCEILVVHKNNPKYRKVYYQVFAHSATRSLTAHRALVDDTVEPDIQITQETLLEFSRREHNRPRVHRKRKLGTRRN